MKKGDGGEFHVELNTHWPQRHMAALFRYFLQFDTPPGSVGSVRHAHLHLGAQPSTSWPLFSLFTGLTYRLWYSFVVAAHDGPHPSPDRPEEKMSSITGRTCLCGVVSVVCFAFAATCPAHEKPRSEESYRLALIHADATMITQARRVFNRTGRMDRQDARYFVDPPETPAAIEITTTGHLPTAGLCQDRGPLSGERQRDTLRNACKSRG